MLYPLWDTPKIRLKKVWESSRVTNRNGLRRKLTIKWGKSSHTHIISHVNVCSSLLIDGRRMTGGANCNSLQRHAMPQQTSQSDRCAAGAAPSCGSLYSRLMGIAGSSRSGGVDRAITWVSWWTYFGEITTLQSIIYVWGGGGGLRGSR